MLRKEGTLSGRVDIKKEHVPLRTEVFTTLFEIWGSLVKNENKLYEKIHDWT